MRGALAAWSPRDEPQPAMGAPTRDLVVELMRTTGFSLIDGAGLPVTARALTSQPPRAGPGLPVFRIRSIAA